MVKKVLIGLALIAVLGMVYKVNNPTPYKHPLHKG